jgi:hypothetical protein
MSDTPEITAVLLSMNETTCDRARASVARQSLRFADVVSVCGVTPFHRAINQGAAQVRTEFFLQVDADMVLDPDCVERLSACVGPSVGAVIGMLRDPLYGRVECIKLLRTSEIIRHGFPNSVSPDTDFLQRMQLDGRYMVYALRHDTDSPATWHTFGEHRPEYDPLFTFEKNKRDGRRLRHRGEAGAVRYHLDLLHGSAHPCARIAEVGIAHGLFFDWEQDRQDGRLEAGEDFEFIRRLLADPDRSATASGGGGGMLALAADAVAATYLVGSAETVFRRNYALGSALARGLQGARFEAALAARHRIRHPWAWLAQAALCRGLLAGVVSAASVEADWSKLAVFSEAFHSTTPLRLAKELARDRVISLASALKRRS